MKTSQDCTGGAIAPVALAIEADQPVPVGFLRVAPNRVVNVAIFLRDVMGSMANNAIDGTHDERMQQVTAAAIGIEIARAVSPALGRFIESLCFPDERGVCFPNELAFKEALHQQGYFTAAEPKFGEPQGLEPQPQAQPSQPVAAGLFKRGASGQWFEVQKFARGLPGVVTLYHGADWPASEQASHVVDNEPASPDTRIVDKSGLIFVAGRAYDLSFCCKPGTRVRIVWSSATEAVNVYDDTWDASFPIAHVLPSLRGDKQ